MNNVFIYRWVELLQDDTWYGSVSRYEMALSRKKGYEEAVFGNLVFCTYVEGPLLLYTDGEKAAAFELAGEKRVRAIREKTAGGSLWAGLATCGINCRVAEEAMLDKAGKVGVIANPANMERFHFLHISLNKGKNNALYEYDHGRWRYGSDDVYRLLAHEYKTWGSV
jgi:hypothetical protein